MAIQQIGQWIDHKTGLGYSGVKKSFLDKPAQAVSSPVASTAAPKAISTPVGSGAPAIATDVPIQQAQNAPQSVLNRLGGTTQPTQAQNQNTAFLNGVMELLKNYQTLGTAKYNEAGLRAQGEMAKRTMAEATPGMSPAQQAMIRGADVSAEQPNYAGAQAMGKTFAEQLSGMGSALEQARLIGEAFQADEQARIDSENENKKEVLNLLTKFPSAFKMLPDEQKKQIEAQIGFKGLIDSLPDEDTGMSGGSLPNSYKEWSLAGGEAGTGMSYADYLKGSSKEDKNQSYAIEIADRIIGSVDNVLKNASWHNTGFGSWLSILPGSSAYDLKKAIDQIKANIGFQELNAMRAASPTGGALGQIAVQELNMLQSVLGSLDTAQSESQLKENLNSIKTHFKNWKAAVNEANGSNNSNSSSNSSIDALRSKYNY